LFLIIEELTTSVEYVTGPI